MGQHKSNPTAMAAAKGEIPPKPKGKSKAEVERELRQMLVEYMNQKTPIGQMLKNFKYL